jgi:hypothetical protein
MEPDATRLVRLPAPVKQLRRPQHRGTGARLLVGWRDM